MTDVDNDDVTEIRARTLKPGDAAALVVEQRLLHIISSSTHTEV